MWNKNLRNICLDFFFCLSIPVGIVGTFLKFITVHLDDAGPFISQLLERQNCHDYQKICLNFFQKQST